MTSVVLSCFVPVSAWASATVRPRPSAEISPGARPRGLGTFHKTRVDLLKTMRPMHRTTHSIFNHLHTSWVKTSTDEAGKYLNPFGFEIQSYSTSTYDIILRRYIFVHSVAYSFIYSMPDTYIYICTVPNVCKKHSLQNSTF